MVWFVMVWFGVVTNEIPHLHICNFHHKPMLEECDLVPWPDDFIPETKSPKPTADNKTPMESRFKHVLSLDRRIAGQRLLPFPQPLWSDFKPRLDQLRTGTVKWGSQRVDEYFVKTLNSKYDGEKGTKFERLVLLDGRSIRCLKNFTAYIKAGPWDDRMRALVHFAQDQMWDVSNCWALALEEEFVRMLGIRFTGERCDGSKPERDTPGNCAHHLFVKSKGTLVSQIRNTTIRAWREAIYTRRPKAKDSTSPPKLNRDLSKGLPKIMHYENTLFAITGFGGWIGYCEGHPHLLQLQEHLPVSSPQEHSLVSSVSSVYTVPALGLPPTISVPAYETMEERTHSTMDSTSISNSIFPLAMSIEEKKAKLAQFFDNPEMAELLYAQFVKRIHPMAFAANAGLVPAEPFHNESNEQMNDESNEQMNALSNVSGTAPWQLADSTI
jgi:hypothetical protein